MQKRPIKETWNKNLSSKVYFLSSDVCYDLLSIILYDLWPIIYVCYALLSIILYDLLSHIYYLSWNKDLSSDACSLITEQASDDRSLFQDTNYKSLSQNIVSFIGPFLLKRPIILSILLTKATPYLLSILKQRPIIRRLLRSTIYIS